jgi:hypothetical protein
VRNAAVERLLWAVQLIPAPSTVHMRILLEVQWWDAPTIHSTCPMKAHRDIHSLDAALGSLATGTDIPGTAARHMCALMLCEMGPALCGASQSCTTD